MSRREYERARYAVAKGRRRHMLTRLTSSHADESMRLYADKAVYSPHLARLLFQRSRIQAQVGDPSAKSTLHSAFAILKRVRPNEGRFAEELSEADFDELVGIWER